MEELRKREAAETERADLQKAAAIEAVAESGLRPWAVMQVQHGEFSLRVRRLLRWECLMLSHGIGRINVYR